MVVLDVSVSDVNVFTFAGLIKNRHIAVFINSSMLCMYSYRVYIRSHTALLIVFNSGFQLGLTLLYCIIISHSAVVIFFSC